MQYKTLIEKLRWSKNIDLDRQLMALNGNIRNYFRQEKCPDFYLKLHKGEKTYPQLKAFYEAVNQLLPQYNAKQEELGEMIFNEDEFKFILKYAGGWYKEIKNKNGDVIPIEKSFKDITKDEMIMVLKKIDRWAMMRGFSLCIDKQLMDLIKNE
jgi:hypothetical protein